MTLSDIDFRDAVFPSATTPDVCAAAVSDRWTALCAWLATFSGEADREGVARAAALGLMERGDGLPGRPITGELFRDARAAAVRAGLAPTDASVMWLRETARFDLGRTGSILGMPITEVSKRHADVAWSKTPPATSEACVTARREFLGIWLDDLRSPAAVLSRSHRDGCDACGAAWSAIVGEGTSPQPARPIAAAPTAADFAVVAAHTLTVDRRRRRLPWAVAAVVLLGLVALRFSRDGGGAPPVSRVAWWKAEIGAPALDLVSRLAGRGGALPSMTATLGPGGQFHLAMKGWAFVPGNGEGPGELVPLPKGRIGHLGYDGAEAWWEAGDRKVRPVSLSELEGRERAVLGVLDALRRVLGSVDAGTASLGEGIPARLDGRDVMRHKIKLSPLGGEGKGEATLWIDADGTPRKVAFGPVVATLEKLVPTDGRSPCGWKWVLPDAVKVER
ncbi:MAG: hypothetical protein RIS21_635 [Planctomycetota bacterium]